MQSSNAINKQHTIIPSRRSGSRFADTLSTLRKETVGLQCRSNVYKHKARCRKDSQHSRPFARRSPRVSNVNTLIPRAAPKSFKQQQARRAIWMLEAKARGATPKRADKLLKAVEQQQKRLKRLSHRHQRPRKDGRAHFAERAKSQKDPEKRLAAWHKHVLDDQQTTRNAGFAWARNCYYTDVWGNGILPPSREAFADIVGHFLKPPRGISYSWPRDRICDEAKRVLAVYDTRPIKPDSKEMVKSRIRMVREMLLEGALEAEKAKGLEVSSHEIAQAILGLVPTGDEAGSGNRSWRLLELPENAHFYRQKEIDWKSIDSWVDIGHKQLPLRFLVEPADLLREAEVAVRGLRIGDDAADQNNLDVMSEDDDKDGESRYEDIGSESEEETIEAYAERLRSMTDDERMALFAFK